MSGSLNKVLLIGHLGDDPQMRTGAGGKPIATFSIATAQRWRDQSGERRERTEWHRVVVFNETLAKVADEHLKKGSKVYLEGSLQTREWDDRGTKRWTTEIVLGPFHSALVLLDKIPSNRPPPADDLDDYGHMR